MCQKTITIMMHRCKVLVYLLAVVPCLNSNPPSKEITWRCRYITCVALATNDSSDKLQRSHTYSHSSSLDDEIGFQVGPRQRSSSTIICGKTGFGDRAHSLAVFHNERDMHASSNLYKWQLHILCSGAYGCCYLGFKKKKHLPHQNGAGYEFV